MNDRTNAVRNGERYVEGLSEEEIRARDKRVADGEKYVEDRSPQEKAADLARRRGEYYVEGIGENPDADNSSRNIISGGTNGKQKSNDRNTGRSGRSGGN